MTGLRRVAVCVAGAIAAAAPAAQHRSGLDPATFDRSVRPQDDLYRYVNGGWLDGTVMPDERVVYTAATELQERVEQDLRALIEEIAARPDRRPGSAAQKIGDLYTSIVDTAHLEALGHAPLAPELSRIEGARTPGELAAVAGHLSATSTAGPFFGTVAVDPRNGARVVHLSQGGTLLPDREYYLSLAADFPRLRREYRNYLAHIYRLVGRAAPDADADAVLAFETALARAQWTQTESRDAARTSNPYTLDRLAAEMPGFDWRAWARPQGFDRASTIVVAQPTFFRRFAELLPGTPLSTLQAWLAGRYITALAPYVSEAFNVARFEFFGRTLTGQQEHRPRWRRGVSLVSEYLGDEIGRRYVQRHFPATSRTRVQAIVVQVVRAYRDAVRGSTWMSPRARAEALNKLATLSAKIGYPDRWRTYRGLEIRAGDLMGNVQRAQRFANAYRMSRVGARRDRDDWLMTPQTVNAYYSPAENEIVFPAAILQPPYFTAGADDAVNYGAIGAVVGHEIGHALDDRGRRYDARGAARDWWTPADEQAYGHVTRALVEQYYGYRPQPGMRVNGALTLGENAGDLAGLAIAFRAYQRALGGRPSAVVDGFTGEQRFFLGWARIWRSLERDEYQRQMLLNSPYAPAPFRANGPVSHLDGFHAAFAVGPADRLYRAPEGRVRIW
jgi:predicted metalloendopeptidase